MIRHALLNLLSQRVRPTDSISGVRFLNERCWEAQDNLVEEMVDQEHLRSWITIRAIDTAIERSCHVEG